MKFYSKIFKAKTIVSVFIIIWIIILVLITINHSLSCVDIKGHFKNSCGNLTYVRSSYRSLLDRNSQRSTGS